MINKGLICCLNLLIIESTLREDKLLLRDWVVSEQVLPINTTESNKTFSFSSKPDS